MYNHFKNKYPTADFSYELYRTVVADLNISFTKLGQEDCWECSAFHLHQQNNHLSKNDTCESDCQVCEKWKKPNEKAKSARAEYRKDAEVCKDDHLFVSAALQKVIMLPRLEMHKDIIFIPRIIAFNESFVPLGKKNKYKPFAIIW